MVQELAGKKVKLEFNDEAAAYGTLGGAANGFFKILGSDGSVMYYNIAHVISIEENDGAEAEEDDAEEEELSNQYSM